MRTVAGGGPLGDSGLGTSAILGQPTGLAFSPDGKQLVISTEKQHVIRQLDLTTKTITTVAGNRGLGDAGDGDLATNAEFRSPFSVAYDADGNLIIADRSASRIRKISKATGRIETLVGTGTAGYNGDGPGNQTQLSFPQDIAFDQLGRMFIADASNHRIRMFDPSTGRVTTIAGSGVRGFAGDGGPAVEAG